MANEKRPIDASVLIRDLTAMKSMYDAIALDGIIKALKEAPTVDAVEVVRCKDCKFCETFCPAKEIDKEPIQVWFCKAFRFTCKQDGFCSYGERREGE